MTINMQTMIDVEARKHPIYQELTDKNATDPEDAPFSTMGQVFMWAVGIGVSFGKKEPLAGKRKGIFRLHNLREETDLNLLKAMMLAETDDPMAIMDAPKMCKIAEEYANYGITILQNKLIDNYSVEPLDRLATYAIETDLEV